MGKFLLIGIGVIILIIIMAIIMGVKLLENYYDFFETYSPHIHIGSFILATILSLVIIGVLIWLSRDTDKVTEDLTLSEQKMSNCNDVKKNLINIISEINYEVWRSELRDSGEPSIYLERIKDIIQKYRSNPDQYR